MTRVCNCGSCKQAVERAIGVIGKMFVDGECPQFAIAVGVAMSFAGAETLRVQLAGDYVDTGAPKKIADLLSGQEAIMAYDAVSKLIQGDWKENRDRYFELLNEAITAANKRYTDEHNLPKGD